MAWSHLGNPPAAFNVGSDNTLTVNLSGLTAPGQYLAGQALQAWTNVTGITFAVTTGAAEITFDDNASGVTAYADTNISNGVITSASVMVTTGWLARFGTTFNSYSFETYIHEIGHALGFGHGGNYNGSATYGIDNFYLNDSLAYSIMSYMQAANDEFSGPNTFVNASFRYMLTPQMADIIAVQSLYGDVASHLTGNTTYGFGSNTGNAALDNAVNYGASLAFTIFDEGGVDTLNFANTSANQTLNLNAETFSSVLGGRLNVAIARGVVIENATGGSGADTITGNQAANVLIGNGGANSISGYGGDDTIYGGTTATISSTAAITTTGSFSGAGLDYLDGGAGTDFAAFTGNFSSYTLVSLNPNSGQVIVDGPEGYDTFLGVEYFQFASGPRFGGKIFPPTVIEAAGSTSLSKIVNNYFLNDSSGSGPSLKSFGGSDYSAGELGAWTPIAAERTASGYEIAWKVTGADQYTVWNTDSSGRYLSHAIGVVSGADYALQALESSFQQDLNNDGRIGLLTTALETNGSTRLTQAGNHYFLYDSGGAGPSLKSFGGSDYSAGELAPGRRSRRSARRADTRLPGR